jgi:hypothetical protein
MVEEGKHRYRLYGKFEASLIFHPCQFDVFKKDIIILPVNLGNAHWVCAAINIREKRFEYYDSMGNPDKGVMKVRLHHLRRN